MKFPEKIEFLKTIPLFSSFSEEKIAQIAGLTEEVICPKDAFLCHEGDPGDFLYLIVDGEVGLIKGGIPLKTFQQRGDCLGEMSLLDGKPRSVSLRAITRLRALQIDCEHFDHLLTENSLFGRELFKLLSSRLREDLNFQIEAIQQRYEKLQIMMDDTVHAIALMVEMRDPYTAGHQRRVAKLASAIAKEMGISEEQVKWFHTAGLLHDIGKIAVPAEILSKPGKLSEYEFGIIKSHTHVGYEILKEIEFSWPVAQVAFQHHERLNGSGYPSGISDKDIILEAKIMGVADVVEAMSSHRPYRPALGADKALEEISKNRDILYDFKAVDACLKVFTEKGFKFE
jgi:putative nucleotidyltransferase with HDIG domain